MPGNKKILLEKAMMDRGLSRQDVIKAGYRIYQKIKDKYERIHPKDIFESLAGLYVDQKSLYPSRDNEPSPKGTITKLKRKK